jgi:hypothetical protein
MKLTPDVSPVEVGQGTVRPEGQTWQLRIPPVTTGYHNAQLDDYRTRRRREYRHRPGTRLALSARFSAAAADLVGTAGFGFWNAALGDRDQPIPTLPQAVWFFFAAPPNDLPFGPWSLVSATGRGWFAATLDAGTPRALAWAPLAPLVLLLNQSPAIRARLWPVVRRALGIRAEPIPFSLTDWHDYRLEWRRNSCCFWVDGRLILHTPVSPRGPLGFVCWIDNQYMVATPTGRVAWGTTPTTRPQALTIRDFRLE